VTGCGFGGGVDAHPDKTSAIVTSAVTRMSLCNLSPISGPDPTRTIFSGTWVTPYSSSLWQQSSGLTLSRRSDVGYCLLGWPSETAVKFGCRRRVCSRLLLQNTDTAHRLCLAVWASRSRDCGSRGTTLAAWNSRFLAAVREQRIRVSSGPSIEAIGELIRVRR